MGGKIGGEGGGNTVEGVVLLGGGGIDDCGAIDPLPAGGGGGVRGTLSGGIELLRIVVAGDVLLGETEGTAPGGGGVAAVAV